MRLTKRIHESESNEGYKYPHRAQATPVIVIPLSPRTSAMIFSPRFNISHASTPSIHPPLSRITSVVARSTPSPAYLPSSYHALLLAPARAPRRRVSSSPRERARHPSRSREDHRDASLRSCPTYANVVAVAVTTIAAVALVVVGSSAAATVTIARCPPTTDFSRESVEARVSRKGIVGRVDPGSSRSRDHEGPADARRTDEIVYEEAGSLAGKPLGFNPRGAEGRTISLVREGKSG